ncbi:B12-binding domain-containing radical SAM protein [Azospirillum isscasi]|uniref:Radical SAM protein n=1 Tax=Azospirillum isscasi TaxID=3053926 RepID=A0ABU0WMA1_9PROT|nr:radical SAM protein [Azospirillum isscasi]MDQ2105348.1 radical SAM protein [Azospirillum isscasi]
MSNLKELLVNARNAFSSSSPAMTQASRPIRVMIIQPPTTGMVRSLLPQVEEGGEGIGYKPPLGILSVATLVKRRSDHVVKIIDAQAQRLSPEDLVAEAAAFQPDLVGISAWSDWWYPAYRVGELIKQALPQVHLTYGGPHVAIYPQETLDVPFVDSVVVGDGEVPFLFLCNLVANGVVDNGMPGLHFKAHGVKPAPDHIYIHADLDGLPYPDRTLLPVQAYGSVLSKGRYVTTMITSRGCPHRCTFCKLNFQKNLARSAASVVEEFREIHALGIGEVEIYDDTFTWGKARLKEICEQLIDARLGVEWAVRDRVSKADPEMLALMHKAGCRRIHYGIESGVQRVVDRMRKQITLEQARAAVQAARQAGMTVLTYFMFGNLDETVEDMRRTVEFALELDADYAEFSITIPYAGTEMYDEAMRLGLITEDYWRAYARHPTPDFLPPQLIENNATLADMLAIRNDAVRRFYFRPRYIARELKNLATFGEFVRKTRMGLRLLHSVYSR